MHSQAKTAKLGKFFLHTQASTACTGIAACIPTESIANLSWLDKQAQLRREKADQPQAGKDSPDSFAAGFFLTVKYSIYRLGFSYTDRHGNISFSEVVFSLTGKYSTYTLGFSYTDRHGHHSLKVVFLFGVHTRKHAQ